MSFLRTRIAPTPSGLLHLGNAYSFALTAALAKKTNARILLRIDDLDQERVQREYLQDIFDTLHFMDISWEEGPKSLEEFEEDYSQLKRMNIYTMALNKLKKAGKVYACNCSRSKILSESPDGIYSGTCRHKNIPLDARDVSWRLNTSERKELLVKTFKGEVISTTLPRSMNDFIVRKKDGFPAYQLTSLMDDLHFGIDLIIRGEDLWHSTLAQMYLASVMGEETFSNITFYHHPLLLSQEGKKLSKSKGDTSIQHFRTSYKTPEHLYEHLNSLLKTEPALWRV
jgi:glutamyl/glutaminyl-tRNA synthetase